MSNITIGIIGNGRFGNLLFQTFKSSTLFNPKIYSRNAKVDNIMFFSLDEVCKSDILIPAVPISAFEETIKLISQCIKPNCLIVDVCSVKIHPVNIMLENLNSYVDILATHPMFGPDSTKNGTTFKNLKFIFSEIRINNIENKRKSDTFLKFWKNLGCEMVKLSPEEHDRQAAYTHAYAFLIGKIGIELGIRKNFISTKGLECILYNQTAVEHDTRQLFSDIMRYNPFTKEMRRNFKRALINIEEKLEDNLGQKIIQNSTAHYGNKGYYK